MVEILQELQNLVLVCVHNEGQAKRELSYTSELETDDGAARKKMRGADAGHLDRL